MSNISRIEDILNQTSERIENFQKSAGKNIRDVSSSEWDNLHDVLKSSHAELKKSLKGTKQKPNFSDKTMNRIWKAILSLPGEPATQVKVGTLETSLFYQTVKEFQNLLEQLKIKRGQKAEKVDLGGL